MGILRLLLLSSLLITTAVVESRPISWSGGSTLMYKTNSMISSYYYHFSPSYQYSIGAEYINDRYFNEQYINIRSTYLLDRKNTKSSQRNLYLTGAVSTKKSEDFYYGIHGDWETRRYFSSFSAINKNTVSKDFSEYEMQLGVAPYLGDYNELHTWVMIKTKKDTLNNEWDTYPFIKLFKGDFLLELGTKNSHWDLHFMKRF